MEYLLAWLGFILATYSVMANDAPAQVLGTLMASHPDKRWRLWLGSSVLLLAALITSWVQYDGDISFGRLARIPAVEMQWFYLLAPLGLMILTWVGTPVSTSFMILAVFSSSIVLDEIITKSLVGYGIAFISAFLIWLGARQLQFKLEPGTANMSIWRPLQYLSTGTLWWFWLTHDLANVAVFLPRRHLSTTEFFFVCCTMVASLWLIFHGSGGRVHKFIFRKEGNDMDIRLATGIDTLYALLLFVFKEWNNIPMSTTWVFVGLMGGRVMGRAIGTRKIKKATRIVLIRIGAVSLGGIVSIALVDLVMLLK